MWSLAGSQAIDQLICCFGLESCSAGLSTALGLSCAQGPPVCYLGPVCGAASFCFWWAPTRGFRFGRPARVSVVGSQPGFQVWAPTPLIWVHATGLQVSAGAAYPAFTIQGLRGEEHQRPWLLRGVL